MAPFGSSRAAPVQAASAPGESSGVAFFGAARRRRGLGVSGAPSSADASAVSASVVVSDAGGAALSGAGSVAAAGLRVVVRRRRGLGASSAGGAASVGASSAPTVAASRVYVPAAGIVAFGLEPR